VQPQEFPAGPGQTIVVYQPPDTAQELNPSEIYSTIAADAAFRAVEGWRIVSIAVMPLRHAGAFMGREGSGYETKVAAVVAYAQGGA
jgi:hypothetical protein